MNDSILWFGYDNARYPRYDLIFKMIDSPSLHVPYSSSSSLDSQAHIEYMGGKGTLLGPIYPMRSKTVLESLGQFLLSWCHGYINRSRPASFAFPNFFPKFYPNFFNLATNLHIPSEKVFYWDKPTTVYMYQRITADCGE